MFCFVFFFTFLVLFVVLPLLFGLYVLVCFYPLQKEVLNVSGCLCGGSLNHRNLFLSQHETTPKCQLYIVRTVVRFLLVPKLFTVTYQLSFGVVVDP